MGTSKILELRKMTGVGAASCNEALFIFNGNMNKAYRYLEMRGCGVCYFKEGKPYTKQDYIDSVNKQIE